MNAIEQVFGPTVGSASGKSNNELGQEDFLKLLVAQLKNQDPSNPVENGEFLGQIAQFSMVSGIDDLGTSFDGIASSLYASQAMQAAQLVGKQVLVESDTAIHTEGEQVEGLLEIHNTAENVTLHIKDSAGSVVQTIALGNIAPGMHPFKWDGMDNNNELSASGEYAISAEGLVGGELQALPLHLFSTVESISVDRSSTNVVAHLEGGASVPLSYIREFK
ncbi:MAG: hypothetical protein COA96_04920 [SAR86 cluster bacterium]|uniref:Basal-body rod modification protein FlgD n=1 Tax=SAR86 cluster bacterium TaxID=2030880 RepID=A0A2A5B5C1_9GAMM|nr:MAG: hypothetical protein COA96_04920 [SAR86 cluster bacterium]